MFCPKCGQPNEDGARFCASCGGQTSAAAPAAPAPAAAPPPPAPSAAGQTASIHARLQGVDREYKANGSYDEVDLGLITPDNTLQVLRFMLPQTAPDGDDICPVAGNLKGPGGEIGFYVEDGACYGVESGTAYTPEQLVARVMGQLGAPPPKVGWQPVRKHHIPPTDLDTIEPGTIDMGPTCPQISVRIWGNGICGPALFGFMWLPFAVALMISLAALSAGDALPILGGIAGTVFCLWLLRLIWTSGHQHIQVGVDWNTNALWVRRGEETWFTPNANCIRGFRAAALYGDPNNDGSTLEMDRTDEERDTLGGLVFEKKTEAPRVAAAVNGLLASQ